MLVEEARSFCEVCLKNGSTATQQRQVLNEVLVEEESAGYLAGYRVQNIRLLLPSGLFPRSEHASWLASVDMKDESHCHMGCSKC